MKKLFTLLLIVVATVAAQSQVIIYEAEEAEMTTTEDWDESKGFEVDPGLMIVVNLENETIKIFNNYDDLFFIRGSKEFVLDQNGYDQKTMLSQCVDKEGRECLVAISYYLDDSIAFGGEYEIRVRIFYPDIWYGYYCNVKSMTGYE